MASAMRTTCRRMQASPGGAGSFDPATGDVLVAGVGSVSKSMNVTAYKTGFVPRLGVAYQIEPKTVLRAGFGSSFTPAGLGAVFGQAPDYDPPIILPQQLNPSSSYDSVYDFLRGRRLPTCPPWHAAGALSSAAEHFGLLLLRPAESLPGAADAVLECGRAAPDHPVHVH